MDNEDITPVNDTVAERLWELAAIPHNAKIEVDGLVHHVVNNYGPHVFIDGVVESVLNNNPPPETPSVEGPLDSMLSVYQATESPEFLRGVIAGSLEVLLGMDPAFSSIAIERLVKAGIDPLTGHALGAR